jgi:hypothetical protein
LAAYANTEKEKIKMLMNYFINFTSYRFFTGKKSEQMKAMATNILALEERWDREVKPHFEGDFGDYPAKLKFKHITSKNYILPLTEKELE